MSNIFDTLITNRDSYNIYYNTSDLNRVESCAKELSTLLIDAGYHCNGNFKTDWKSFEELVSAEFNAEEWVTVNQMSRYINNLDIIKLQYHMPIGATYPKNMNNLTYIGANNIELFLLMVYNNYIKMLKDYKYCGMLTCGATTLPQ